MKKRETEKTQQLTNSEIQKKAQRRINRLNSIKNEMEAGRIKDFEQIFAIISLSRLSTELGISFYTFCKKVQDPKEWTVGEMMRFSSLLGTDYSTIHEFMLARLKEKSKTSVFRDYKPEKFNHL
ncbi:hypothetical protein Q4E93_29615 [Flavitalea sp. BT771]|uniref:hypothetical protein n=1 Tax=Flavitalea sp. BT771 TaxID=3063329 RepID=UPI0026E1623E|nr:hypothetical protein [Flavitalea sp. BT771]MDO6434807.1 hypothetical protein [Flavitalea sp. BT771]MDV6223707.1 hypothetical protein [Flavitalea sp. BT771]